MISRRRSLVVAFRAVCCRAAFLAFLLAPTSGYAAPIPVLSYLFDSNTNAQYGAPAGTLFGPTGIQTSGPIYSTTVPLSYAGNRSLHFDGTDDTVRVGTKTVAPLLAGASAASFAARIYYESPLENDKYGNVVFTNRINNGDAGGLWINIRGDIGNVGRLLIGGRSKSADSFQEAYSAAALSADAWHLIVGVLDFANNRIQISVDGGLLQTTNLSVGAFGSTTYLNDGGGTPSVQDMISVYHPMALTQAWAGYLDEVAIYKVALTNSDISNMLAIGIRPVPEPSSLTLGLLGLVGLVPRLRRRR